MAMTDFLFALAAFNRRKNDVPNGPERRKPEDTTSKEAKERLTESIGRLQSAVDRAVERMDK